MSASLDKTIRMTRLSFLEGLPFLSRIAGQCQACLSVIYSHYFKLLIYRLGQTSFIVEAEDPLLMVCELEHGSPSGDSGSAFSSLF